QAVIVEFNRRKQATKNKTATTKSSKGHAASRDKKIGEIDEIPEGRANLIRASFRAGIKPATIARTFRISQSLVARVLSSIEGPKR
ncbi:MAG TPA: hypothetical protein VIK79_07935, partial [Xanthobacteraceae bacterium]